jgi:MIP family channel proteins
MDPEPVQSQGREPTRRPEVKTSRRLAAEFVGTYFLVMVAAGIEVVAVMRPGQIDRSMKAFASGMVVAAMIYALGDVSGAHLNPVVTLTFGLRRAFEWRLVPAYWVAQLGGAIAAGFTIRHLLGTVGDVGINHLEGLSATKGLFIEALFTSLLIIVILNVAHKHSLLGTDAALAVGATIAVCGLVGGELTTMSMNPARSIGPAIAAGTTRDLWVYVLGPAIGALAGLGIFCLLRPHRNPDEFEAAGGDDTESRAAPV